MFIIPNNIFDDVYFSYFENAKKFASLFLESGHRNDKKEFLYYYGGMLALQDLLKKNSNYISIRHEEEIREIYKVACEKWGNI